MKRGISILLLVACLGTHSLHSQDIHFSQYYASPLTLNPAMTGVISGCYRGVLMHRNQWSSFLEKNSYVTFAATGDMQVFRNRIMGNDFVGAGIVLARDQSGTAGLSLNDAKLSGSYHKRLTEKHQLGAGLQLGYVQRKINYSDLIFPAQYDKTTGNFDRSPNEDLDNTSTSYFDMNTGVFWSGIFTENIAGFGGVAMFHVTQPKYSFLDDDNRLKSRYVIHGGSNIRVGNMITVIPNFITMHQRGAFELNLGSTVEYNIPNNKVSKADLSLGGWFRTTRNVDALILVAGIEYKNFKIGTSYDFNISSLSTVSRGKGGLEISLSYTAPCSEPLERNMQLTCPRF